MGRWFLVVASACWLAGCGGSTWPQYKQLALEPPPAPPDAGPPAEPPPSVSFTTELGTLTGSEAFRVVSAQTLFQRPDGGAPSYVGFQVTDTAQCLPAELDGGPGDSRGPVTHVLTAFVRDEDGAPVQPGTYAIGLTADGKLDTYLQLVELDADSGVDRILLATSGTLTLSSLTDGGEVSAELDVQLGDPENQLELPLSGSFTSQSCVPQ